MERATLGCEGNIVDNRQVGEDIRQFLTNQYTSKEVCYLR